MWEKFWSWPGARKVAVAIIVLMSAGVLGSVLDSCQSRGEARRILEDAGKLTEQLEAQKETARTFREENEVLKTRVAEADRKAAASRRRLEEARVAAGRPFAPPAGPADLAERFNRLGFRGRVK